MHGTTTILQSRRAARALLGRGSAFALVLGLHLALAAALASMSARPPAAEELARLDLRIIEAAPLPPAIAPKRIPMPKHPPAPKERPVQPVQPLPAAAPAPVMTTNAATAPAPAAFTPAPQAKAAPVSLASPAPPPAPAPAKVTPARFDADYLHNPAPAYPRAARRYGDQGRVLLKVLVSAQGTARTVEVEASSGSARLDQAAQHTVSQWRFVPARRGSESIDDWVLVPVVFRLDS